MPYIPFALVKGGINSYPRYPEYHSLSGKKPKFVREGRGKDGQGKYREELKLKL